MNLIRESAGAVTALEDIPNLVRRWRPISARWAFEFRHNCGAATRTRCTIGSIA